MKTEIQVKPRNQTEVDFIADVTTTAQNIIDKFGLSVDKLRFARKAGWGGNGAAHSHLYKYRDGTYELWVNIRNTALDQDFKDYLKSALISGARYWALADKKVALDYTDADATLYTLRTGKDVSRLMQGKKKMPIRAKRYLANQRYTYETTAIYEAEASRNLRDKLEAAEA